MEKNRRYTVYRMTVKEAMAKCGRDIALDRAASGRRISFFYNDEFTYPSKTLATPPPSAARTVPSALAVPSARDVPRERTTEESVRAAASEAGTEPLWALMKIEDPGMRRCALEARALAIGRGESTDWHDLTSLVGSEFHSVRRLAASAMKKRMETDGRIGKAYFGPLIEALVAERYPQVQQYMLSALKRCAKFAVAENIEYLRDVARDPTLAADVRETANSIIHDYEVHRKLKESTLRHWCHRCKRPITKAESAVGIARYGKPYCKRCFDERALGDVDFEREVEGAKTRRTTDGVAVQSKGEKRIADWLSAHGLAYEYDERFRIVEDTTIRPDFYLREFDLYIEYWGMNTDSYNANRRKKHELYQREGRKLISLSWEDDRHLEDRLLERLSLHIPSLAADGGGLARRIPELN